MMQSSPRPNDPLRHSLAFSARLDSLQAKTVTCPACTASELDAWTATCGLAG
jgi:hypothetical protein